MSDFDSADKIQASLDASPFISFCGLRVEAVQPDEGRLVLTMPMRPELGRRSDAPQMHGGPIAALIDTAGCYACMMVLGHGVPTVNFRTDYFRPVMDSGLRAVAQVRRAGRAVAVADVDLFDDQDRLVAVGRATFSASAG